MTSPLPVGLEDDEQDKGAVLLPCPMNLSGRTLGRILRIQTDIYTIWTVLQKARTRVGPSHDYWPQDDPAWRVGVPAQLAINIMEGLFCFNNGGIVSSVCIRQTNKRLLIKWGIAIRIDSPGR